MYILYIYTAIIIKWTISTHFTTFSTSLSERRSLHPRCSSQRFFWLSPPTKKAQLRNEPWGIGERGFGLLDPYCFLYICINESLFIDRYIYICDCICVCKICKDTWTCRYTWTCRCAHVYKFPLQRSRSRNRWSKPASCSARTLLVFAATSWASVLNCRLP